MNYFIKRRTKIMEEKNELKIVKKTKTTNLRDAFFAIIGGQHE